MQVSKSGNSLAVRLPTAVVDALDLKEGDQIEIRIARERVFEVSRDQSKPHALARLRKLRRPLPPGFVFDREEANARYKAFFDTNVLIYVVGHYEAEELHASGGVVSVQIFNEFASVARRKISMSWSDVTEALDAFRVLCPSPLPITIEMHEAALKIAEKHEYNLYDALVVSAALEAGCATLYSENLHDGQTIGGRLTIRNPFVGSSGYRDARHCRSIPKLQSNN